MIQTYLYHVKTGQKKRIPELGPPSWWFSPYQPSIAVRSFRRQAHRIATMVTGNPAFCWNLYELIGYSLRFRGTSWNHVQQLWRLPGNTGRWYSTSMTRWLGRWHSRHHHDSHVVGNQALLEEETWDDSLQNNRYSSIFMDNVLVNIMKSGN